jgi:hypothetical protein
VENPRVDAGGKGATTFSVNGGRVRAAEALAGPVSMLEPAADEPAGDSTDPVGTVTPAFLFEAMVRVVATPDGASGASALLLPSTPASAMVVTGVHDAEDKSAELTPV